MSVPTAIAAGLVVHYGPKLAGIVTTAAFRKAANLIETATQKNTVDHVFGGANNAPVSRPTVRQSLNNQTLFNATNHRAEIATKKALEADLSNTPTLKPKGGPQAGG